MIERTNVDQVDKTFQSNLFFVSKQKKVTTLKSEKDKSAEGATTFSITILDITTLSIAPSMKRHYAEGCYAVVQLR